MALIEDKTTIPVRERAYEHLRSSLLSGDFNPGERLTEERLARELGISRTPVREALHKLELEGLIKPLETRGFIVPADSREEVEGIFEIRAILEGYALRIISAHLTDSVLEQLEAIIQSAEEALRNDCLEDIYLWNTRFHDTLLELFSDKNRLCEQMVTLREYVLRYRRNTLQLPDGGRRMVDGHRTILLALQLRDPDLCERVMRHHIQEAGRDAVRFLFGENEEVASGKTH